MAGAFQTGFALGQNAWNSAVSQTQRAQMLQMQQDEHDARMKREREEAEQRQRQRDYEQQQRDLPTTETAGGMTMPVGAAMEQVGLRGQQAQLLADQDAAFGSQGDVALLNAAAPAAGLAPRMQYAHAGGGNVVAGENLQTRTVPQAALLSQRLALAEQAGRFQDAAYYNQRLRDEAQRIHENFARGAGSIASTLNEKDSTPEDYRSAYVQLLKLRQQLYPDSVQAALGEFNGHIVPMVIGEDGIQRPITDEKGVPMTARLNHKDFMSTVDRLTTSMLNPAQLPEQRRAAARDVREQQTHEQGLEKNALDIYLTQQGLPEAVLTPGLRNEQLRAQTEYLRAHGQYFANGGARRGLGTSGLAPEDEEKLIDLTRQYNNTQDPRERARLQAQWDQTYAIASARQGKWLRPGGERQVRDPKIEEERGKLILQAWGELPKGATDADRADVVRRYGGDPQQFGIAGLAEPVNMPSRRGGLRIPPNSAERATDKAAPQQSLEERFGAQLDAENAQLARGDRLSLSPELGPLVRERVARSVRRGEDAYLARERELLLRPPGR